ncbi:hypothetical protein [Siphonobacter curvatus]|uniref:Uncharacterized protein n=1 Tax=Siphonobacter curvatus TaxID=2094562 RepID=A0A2S7IEV3_9BACT|nr:hypothetical protein [Siphonobacter curvatus]PQA53210.1 hypothetical protein C5O19_25105 [Siphonobacter curvatus]
MKGLRTLIIILLLGNGLSALAGGLALIMDPSGGALQLPLGLLRHSPFTTFLIPGLGLLIINGMPSLYTIWTVIQKRRYYPLFVVGQGLLLIAWISVQVGMIREVSILHYSYAIMGIALVGSGTRLRLSQPI